MYEGQEPIYRAELLSKYQPMFGEKLEKLKNFEVFYWPDFAITSKNRECCLKELCEYDGEEEAAKKVLFKIHTSDKYSNDKVQTTIDMTKDSSVDWSEYP